MGSDQLAASADRTFFNTARESQSKTIWLSPIHISTKWLASAIENCQLGEAEVGSLPVAHSHCKEWFHRVLSMLAQCPVE